MPSTIEELVAAAAASGPAAPDRDRKRSAGVWGGEYDDYARMSDDLRRDVPHYLDLRYGPDPRHILDVYRPAAPVPGAPADVVKAMVSVGGRYGLWQANAVVSGGDAVNPAHEWRLARAPRAVVVYGEEEYDGTGEEVPERGRDCAIIGHGLAEALRADGAPVEEVALSPRGHWQTLRSLADEDDRTVPAVLAALGVDR